MDYAKPDPVLIKTVGNESLLLNTASETYFGLDEVGTRLYRSLVDGATLDDTIEKLLAEFDTDKATLRRDCEAVLEQLQSRQLIVRRGA